LAKGGLDDLNMATGIELGSSELHPSMSIHYSTPSEMLTQLNSSLHLYARAEILLEISVPSAPPSQLSYDEYTDRTLSVGR